MVEVVFRWIVKHKRQWHKSLVGSPNGVILEQSHRFEFETTNNQVEYEVFLVEMRLAKEVGAKHLKGWSDSNSSLDN